MKGTSADPLIDLRDRRPEVLTALAWVLAEVRTWGA